MFWWIGLVFAMPTNFITPNGVQYNRVQENTSFQQWIASLPTSTIPTESNAAQAFWINAYNGLTIDAVSSGYPIDSIRSLDNGQIWTTRKFMVGGTTVTLDEIEKVHLAKFKDPRHHAALNCAAKGCPVLSTTPYTGAGLDSQLTLASQQWISTNAFRWEDGWFTNSLHLSKIFDWYASDFPCDPSIEVPEHLPKQYCGVIQFIVQYAPTDQTQLLDKSYSIEWIEYDWSLNDVQ